MAKKAPEQASAIADIEAQADAIRAELKVPKQSEVFKAAVEAGYLTALADGEVDATELATMVKAVEILSQGAVIEWETEALLSECAERAKKEGAAERAAAVGATLKSLGQGEAGLFLAALVARASKGIDKKEAEMLKSIGGAAGLSSDTVKTLVKKATTLKEE